MTAEQQEPEYIITGRQIIALRLELDKSVVDALCSRPHSPLTQEPIRVGTMKEPFPPPGCPCNRYATCKECVEAHPQDTTEPENIALRHAPSSCVYLLIEGMNVRCLDTFPRSRVKCNHLVNWHCWDLSNQREMAIRQDATEKVLDEVRKTIDGGLPDTEHTLGRISEYLRKKDGE